MDILTGWLFGGIRTQFTIAKDYILSAPEFFVLIWCLLTLFYIYYLILKEEKQYK